MDTSKLLANIVLCSYKRCAKTMVPDEALWNEGYDLPYCSYEHLNIDGKSQLQADINSPESEDYPWDDPRSEGYVSPEDAQENYLLTMEAYDDGR